MGNKKKKSKVTADVVQFSKLPISTEGLSSVDIFNLLNKTLGFAGIEPNKKVYRISAEDVMSVLEDQYDEHIDSMTAEDLKELVLYVKQNMEIPWTEYVSASLSLFFADRKKGEEQA